MTSIHSTTSSHNPYQNSYSTYNEQTEKDKSDEFKSSLREDATQLSKIELDGSKKLALLDSAIGSQIDIHV